MSAYTNYNINMVIFFNNELILHFLTSCYYVLFIYFLLFISIDRCIVLVQSVDRYMYSRINDLYIIFLACFCS